MNMARYARAKVLLTGDIDRGGVYASFLGTWMTFSPWERELLAGFVVNKFRGDSSLLAPAHRYMQEHTGKPVLGVIPMIRNINIPEEDRAVLPFEYDESSKHADSLDVAVVMPAHISNFTDFAPLAAEPDVRLRQVRTGDEWGQPDLVILPGTKSVAADLERMRRPDWTAWYGNTPEKENGSWASAAACKCWERKFWTRIIRNRRRNALPAWDCWN